MKNHKLKDPKYARPVILTDAEFAKLLIREFEKSNPGKNWKDFSEDWD